MACDQNNEIDDLNREECASEMEEDCSNYSEQQNMNDKVEEVVDDDDIDDEEGPIICADDSNYQLISHTKDVFCLTISHSKRWLASGSEDDFAFVWDLTTTPVERIEPYMKIESHRDSVNCVLFNSNDTLLATSDMSGYIIITEVESKIQRCKIDDCDEIEWILWHSSADILFGGNRQGVIWMWLISTDGVQQSKVYSRSSTGVCTKGKLLSDSKRLFAIYDDGEARVWDLRNATAISVKLTSACISLDVHSTQPVAAVGCADGTTKLLSTDSLKVLNTFGMGSEDSADDSNSVEVVCFAPAPYAWLAIGTISGILSIYDIQTGGIRYSCGHDEHAVVNCMWRLNERNFVDGITQQNLSLDIISICMDGGLRIWDAKTGEPIRAISCGVNIGEGIFDVCFSDRYIFVGCCEGVIRIFKA